MISKYKYLSLISFILLITVSCSTKHYVRNTFSYPKPVDTTDKKIELQNKKVYKIDGIYADNNFDGARLNNFTKINDSTYQVNIKPENFPINNSAWYAFKLKSDTEITIYIKLKYTNGNHRYNPKISYDRKLWKNIDTRLIKIEKDKNAVIFPVKLNQKYLWVAAQEIINTTDVKNWINTLKNNKITSDFKSIGKSEQGRELPYFRIGNSSSKGKKVIVLMSRQHPPEITGFLAFQYFVEELTKTHKLSIDFFKKYDVWVFPTLNPDGVDLGHWRHNSNGVDLNRDWAYYNQQEINSITEFIVNKTKSNQNEVILGIDFHSTQKDVYYVYDNSLKTKIPNFKEYWTESIDRIVAPFKSIYSPEGITKPFSKTWFYMQFKAEGMTYEVGDNTPREIIKQKAKVAAITLMDLLLKQKY